MTIFVSTGAPFVPPRDDLTVAQFMFDDLSAHFTRPSPKSDTPCFIDEETGKKVFLEELGVRSRHLGRAIAGRWSCRPGDVVSIFAPNHLDYGVVAWAVHRFGGVVAAHNATLTSEELLHQVKIAEPVLLVAHPENLSTALDVMKKSGLSEDRLILIEAPDSSIPTVASLLEASESYPPLVEPHFKEGEAKSTLAFLCFSSGTTGLPKAVAVSHYNVIALIVQIATYNRISEDYAPWEDRRFRPGDINAGVAPFAHIYGLVVNLHIVPYMAMTLIVSKKFDFPQFLNSIQRYRVTHLSIIPPIAGLLCKHPLTQKYDISSVRYCLIAAAAVTIEVTDQLSKLFPGAHLGQGWAMTETCGVGSMWPVTQRVGTIGGSGQLVSGTEAKVVKPDGTLAGVDEPGELYVRGPQVVMGYYHNEEATKNAFVDGWLRSGDEVIFRENGDIFVVGRIKELIKVGGRQVSPTELEGYLHGHPDVLDAAVVGVPDAELGELPFAYVVLRPNVAATLKDDVNAMKDEQEKLYKHVSTLASRHKWLDGGIVFLDAIPKNPGGKILRGVLMDRAVQDRAAQVPKET